MEKVRSCKQVVDLDRGLKKLLRLAEKGVMTLSLSLIALLWFSPSHHARAHSCCFIARWLSEYRSGCTDFRPFLPGGRQTDTRAILEVYFYVLSLSRRVGQ